MNNPKVIKLSEKEYNEILIYQDHNPNRKYSISVLQYIENDDIIEEELLTDGEIKETKTIEKEGYYTDEDKHIIKRRVVEIKNASYAIIQRTYENSMINAKAFTELQELDKLNQIENISISNNQNEKLLASPKPYVRKITLK